MVNSPLIVNHYPEQKYQTIFNQNSGFLVRLEDQNVSEPSWCSYGPELMDISITNWCDKGCSWCYKKSTPVGLHIALDEYEKILIQAAKMRVLQIALGGGNPNQHPHFGEILRLTREKYNIVPSYTTNGRGLSDDVLTATKKYCGAVAVSAYEPYDETFIAVNKLINHRIRTNIHFLLTSQSIDTAISWLENPNEVLNQVNAIIFLNYKPIGRNPNPKLLAKNSNNLVRFFDLANKKYPFKIGFDSCSISGIAQHLNISPVFVEPCEAGRFSMYISEHSQIYPCSFMASTSLGIPVEDNNIQSVWREHKIFNGIRDSQKNEKCIGCASFASCSGGCPVYPEINLCSP
jgi:radical SAM protein with 4Fe4S-binding SPASM domain